MMVGVVKKFYFLDITFKSEPPKKSKTKTTRRKAPIVSNIFSNAFS